MFFSVLDKRTPPLLIIYQRNKATSAFRFQRLKQVANWLRTIPQAVKEI